MCCVIKYSSMTRTGYSWLCNSTARHIIAVQCSNAYYPYCSSSCPFHIAIAAAFVNIISSPTNLPFVRFIRFCAPEYRRGHFFSPRCMHPIGITVYAFGHTSQEERPNLRLRLCGDCSVCNGDYTSVVP